jgi:ParB family transcriptional regulator, chromosome partitioning protein
VKRRDTIRSLYSATTEPTKLAAANPRPDHGADQGDQVSANAPDRAPPPEKLAMANSRSEDVVEGRDLAGAAPPDDAPSPAKLAMANSRLGETAQDGRVLAGPVRTMGLSLNRLDEDRRVLQEALARGETIIDIDPALIDPSFVRDRLDNHGDSFAEFKRLIEERGQEVPILVRPHPDRPGRYQVAYGHRRLRALRELGRHVRAVVRALDDAQLVVAQGLENSARQDLTYIEKAVFARRLEDRGFERPIIIDALSTDKGELSKLIAVARAIPESIVNRIGPAPKAGRRRWLALAEQLKTASVAKAIEEAVMGGRSRSSTESSRSGVDQLGRAGRSSDGSDLPKRDERYARHRSRSVLRRLRGLPPRRALCGLPCSRYVRWEQERKRPGR